MIKLITVHIAKATIICALEKSIFMVKRSSYEIIYYYDKLFIVCNCFQFQLVILCALLVFIFSPFFYFKFFIFLSVIYLVYFVF